MCVTYAALVAAGKMMVLEALLKAIRQSEPTDKVVLISNYTEVGHTSTPAGCCGSGSYSCASYITNLIAAGMSLLAGRLGWGLLSSLQCIACTFSKGCGALFRPNPHPLHAYPACRCWMCCSA
jgi:hypothetical protein